MAGSTRNVVLLVGPRGGLLVADGTGVAVFTSARQPQLFSEPDVAE